MTETTQITAAEVKKLRDLTNISMGECKKALVESGGNQEEAVKWLRERGMAIADKKSSRAAEQGLIAVNVADDAQSGSLIEVNCETDFVAKNPDFIAYVADLSQRSAGVAKGAFADQIKEELSAKIAEIGENLILKRNLPYAVEGTGGIASYVHLGGQVAVMMELGCEKAETVSNAAFQELGKDLCMHVAAVNPEGISRDDVSEELVAAERAIYEKQMEGKPPEILEKIIGGKIEKFFSQICMLEQGFIKDPDTTVAALIEKTGKELGDTLSLRRFERFQVGTSA